MDQITIDDSLLSYDISLVTDKERIKDYSQAMQTELEKMNATFTSLAELEQFFAVVSQDFSRTLKINGVQYFPFGGELSNFPGFTEGEYTTEISWYAGIDEIVVPQIITIKSNYHQVENATDYATEAYKKAAYTCSKKRVLETATNPKTANFGEPDINTIVTDQGNFLYNVSHEVYAKNALGIEVRNKYQCKVLFDPNTITCGTECTYLQ
jgi:hypothetical protein